MRTLPEQAGVKEAYSLAYAAFRLAAGLGNLAFQKSFEDRGLALLLAALDGNEEKQLRAVRDMEYLVGFGRDIGIIHPQTAELMLAEISKFNPATAEPAMLQIDLPNSVPHILRSELFPQHAPIRETVPAGVP